MVSQEKEADQQASEGIGPNENQMERAPELQQAADNNMQIPQHCQDHLWPNHLNLYPSLRAKRRGDFLKVREVISTLMV